MDTPESNKKHFPASNEIRSGDTLYKITSIYADKGDFHVLWEELIIKAVQTNLECIAS